MPSPLRWAWRWILIAGCLLLITASAPQLPLHQLAQADIAFQNNNLLAAYGLYQQVLPAAPNTLLILERMGRAAQAAQYPALAMPLLQQAVASQHWTIPQRVQQAQLFDELGNRGAALGVWRHIFSLEPTHKAAIRYLLNNAQARADWQDQMTYWQAWLAVEPNDLEAHYRYALLLAPLNPPEAVEHLTRSSVDPAFRTTATALRDILNQPNEGNAAEQALQVGIFMLNQQEWSMAEHAMLTALADQPNNHFIGAYLGFVRDQQGNDGWPLIQAAQQAYPTDATIGYIAAVHWRLVGQAEHALVDLMKLAAADPTNASIAAEIGMAHWQARRLIDAANWLSVAVSMAPDNPQFARLLATFYTDEDVNLAAEGVNVLRKLAAKFPQDIEIIACYGWALIAADNLSEANVQLNRAIQLAPTNIRARYYWALYLEQTGDRQGAIDSLRFVYQSSGNGRFRLLSTRALQRLGVSVTP